MPKANPFYPIGPVAKNFLFLVLAFYWLIFPLLHGITSLGGQGEYQVSRLLMEILAGLLKLLPFLVLRWHFGLFHPLIFIPLIGFAMSVIKQPFTIIEPFLAATYAQDAFVVKHSSLMGYSQFALSRAALDEVVIYVVGLLAYYIGFFSKNNWRVKPLRFGRSKNYRFYMLLFFGVSTAFLLWYLLVYRGGITQSVLLWRGGRAQNLEDPLRWTRPFLDIPVFVLIFWYVLNDKILKSPLFWAAFLSVDFATFLIGGSRSSFIIPFILILGVYLFKNRRVPVLAIIGVGLFGFISIGALGAFRANASFRGEITWESLRISSLEEGLENTQENLEGRYSMGSFSLPVYVRVPEEVDFLYGETYLGALAFFIPRAIWEGKPRGAGIHNAELILERRSGGGVPISPPTEAYWNFWYPGVIFLYFIYGMFHSWLAKMYRSYYRYMAFVLIYFLTLYILRPSSLAFVAYVQSIIPLLALLYIVRSIRPGKILKHRYAPA